MAEATNLPGLQVSALNGYNEHIKGRQAFIYVIDMDEPDPAKRSKRMPVDVVANASVTDPEAPEMGNIFTDKVSIEKTAAHDGGHLQLVNPDITGMVNNENRTEQVLHSSGVWTFRNVTGERIVFTSGNFLHNNVILYDNGNVEIRGTVTANGVVLGGGATGGAGFALFDAAKTYAYNATQPELVLHTVDGKLRIWTLKNTQDTATPQTRSAPSYATNSQWIDVGKDVFESTAQSTIFEEYKAQPGNENKTWADFQAAITGPQGPIGPEGPASTVPGPAGPAGPASTVPGPPGYTPQKGIDYFDGAKGENGILAWLELNPGKTLADYTNTFRGEQGPQGENALLYRILSSLPNQAALPIGPANERDAYSIVDAGDGLPHVWIWLPGPAIWYDFGAVTGLEGPAGPAGESGIVTLTTNGTTGAATYDPATKSLNIPQYAGGSGSGDASYLVDGENTVVTGTGTQADPYQVDTNLDGIYARAQPYVTGRIYELGDLVTQWGTTIQILTPDPDQETTYNFNTAFGTMKEAMVWHALTHPFDFTFAVLARGMAAQTAFSELPGLGINYSDTGLYSTVLADAAKTVTFGFNMESIVPGLVQKIVFTVSHAAAQITWDANVINGTVPALPTYPGAPYTISYEFVRGTNNKMNFVGVVGGSSGTGTSAPAAETLQTLADNGSTVTLNSSTSKEGAVTLTGSRALVISNLPANAVVFGTIEVYQDGTGSRTLTLPAGSRVINGGAGALALTATPNALDLISWRWNGTFLTFTKGPNYN